MPCRASLQTSSGHEAALKTHAMPTTLQTTDWEMFLVHTGVVVPITIFIEVFLQV
jgi:hypothetical protein